MEVREVEEVISTVEEGAKVEVDKWGRAWVKISHSKLKETLKALRDKGYTHLSAITGVDLIDDNILEVLYHLLPERKDLPYLTVRVTIPRDKPVLPSVTDLFPVALLYEDEVYDMLGIKFTGHPDLRRLFLPEELPEGVHPLRKDFKGSIYKEVVK